MAFAACFQWPYFGFCSWHASMEKDQGKVVAGNIVTPRPIYLALMALRKKGLQGLSFWADELSWQLGDLWPLRSGARWEPRRLRALPAAPAALRLCSLLPQPQELLGLSWGAAAALLCPAGPQEVKLEMEQDCEIKSIPRRFGSATFFMSSRSCFANETSNWRKGIMSFPVILVCVFSLKSEL